ncbi:MAG: hypothetical protein H6707_01590 [Deltaproteobacteria bacterium]|nr:hypothetical protein [Deltaproteobacteria bacterium]
MSLKSRRVFRVRPLKTWFYCLVGSLLMFVALVRPQGGLPDEQSIGQSVAQNVARANERRSERGDTSAYRSSTEHSSALVLTQRQ